jgi:arginine utilization protein RocB
MGMQTFREVSMAEFSVARSMTEQAAAEAAEQVTKANQNTMNFVFGAQRLVMEELVFASNELLERARTEAHLFTEFVSKMAGAHSVNGIREMTTECGQHQIDFIRRDSERIFAHGQRMVDAAFKLATRQVDS